MRRGRLHRPRPSRDRLASRFIFAAGTSIVAVTGLVAYDRGLLDPDQILAGNDIVAPAALLAGFLLTTFTALSLRAAAVTGERAVRAEHEVRDLLAMQTRRYSTFERHGWDGVMIVDALGNIRWVGVTAAKMLRFDPQQVTGQSMLGLVHVMDVDEFLAALAVQKESARTFEFRLTDPSGRYRWFECVMSNYVDDEAISGIVLHLRDVSEHHTTKQELRAQSDRLPAAFVDSPFGVALVTAAGRIESANPALASIIGVPARKLESMMLQDLLSPAAQTTVRGAIEKLSDSGPVQREVVLANGRTAVVALTPVRTKRATKAALLQVVGLSGRAAPAGIEDEAKDDDDVSVDEPVAKEPVTQESSADEEDDQTDDVEIDELRSALAEVGAPSAGWADEVVDFDISASDEDDDDEDDDEDSSPKEAAATEDVSPEASPEDEESPHAILRVIASARRSDRHVIDDPRQSTDHGYNSRAMPL